MLLTTGDPTGTLRRITLPVERRSERRVSGRITTKTPFEEQENLGVMQVRSTHMTPKCGLLHGNSK